MVTVDMSSVGEVARRTQSLIGTLTSDISWNYLICCLLLVFAVIPQVLYQAYDTNLRDIPGPWQAKYTRLWLLRAISSRSFHKINLDLHRRHGSSTITLPFFSVALKKDECKFRLNVNKDLSFALPPTNTASMTPRVPKLFTDQAIS